MTFSGFFFLVPKIVRSSPLIFILGDITFYFGDHSGVMLGHLGFFFGELIFGGHLKLQSVKILRPFLSFPFLSFPSSPLLPPKTTG